ncbi:MAG: hypothetical protein ABEJ08_02680 [Halobacteriaceae archaeon]
MPGYPTERSLTVNALHGMLGRAGAGETAVATAPIRHVADAADTYAVGRADATLLGVRVRRPRYEHADRGLCFEVDGARIATLAARAPPGAAYVACPRVEELTDLASTLDRCRFVDVHALRPDTSRLFVPPNGTVTAKVRDAADGNGFETDPANYYLLPADAVRSWADLDAALEAGSAGLSLRAGGEATDAYRAFCERLAALDAALDASAAGGRDALDRLVEHAVAAHRDRYAAAHREPPDPGDPTAAYRRALSALLARSGSGPQRTRGALELVYESGPETEDGLRLGRVDAGRPLSTAETRDDHGAVQETTLSDFG